MLEAIIIFCVIWAVLGFWQYVDFSVIALNNPFFWWGLFLYSGPIGIFLMLILWGLSTILIKIFK